MNFRKILPTAIKCENLFFDCLDYTQQQNSGTSWLHHIFTQNVYMCAFDYGYGYRYRDMDIIQYQENAASWHGANKLGRQNENEQ